MLPLVVLAEMVAVPTLMPRMVPLVTETTEGLEELHVISGLVALDGVIVATRVTSWLT